MPTLQQIEAIKNQLKDLTQRSAEIDQKRQILGNEGQQLNEAIDAISQQKAELEAQLAQAVSQSELERSAAAKQTMSRVADFRNRAARLNRKLGECIDELTKMAQELDQLNADSRFHLGLEAAKKVEIQKNFHLDAPVFCDGGDKLLLLTTVKTARSRGWKLLK